MGKSFSSQLSQYSIEKPNTKDSGYSPVYINPVEFSGIPILDNGCRTLYECFLNAVQNFPENPFLGTRQYNSSGSLGNYAWKSYSEIFKQVKGLVSGFKKLNLLSKSSNLIAIFSKNREEMFVAELACILQNLPVVPLPDNLSTDILAGILSESRPNILICGKAQCDLIITLEPESLLSIKSLIVFDSLREPIKNHIRSLGIDIHEYQEIFRMPEEPIPDNPPKSESLVWIIYTSGTSGHPRGAMLLHRNIISNILSLKKCGYTFYESDSYIMYLPHSHIYDRLMTYILINSGSRIGFNSGDILNIKEDMMLLKPTIFISVPRIFNRFYQIIKQRFSEKSGITKRILESSLKTKADKYNKTGDLSNNFWQKIAFKKVKKSVGNKIRFMVSASAPLNGEILRFLRMVFSCPIVESLGITETAGACMITQIGDIETGHVGGPLSGVEAKLREIPEMGFFCEENRQIGELCVRSSSIFAGYYKAQETTDKVIDSDGWYYTGDILERSSSSGAFKILDRLSNIVKLSQGEFVSLEKIEKVLLISQYVHQIFVYGDGFQHFLIAIVVPNKEFILNKMSYPSIRRNSESDWRNTIKSSKLKNEILEDLKEISNKRHLSRTETVNNIYLEETEWTDKDILTSTQKLNRTKAKTKYIEIIQQLILE